jgi:hypothetical protein
LNLGSNLCGWSVNSLAPFKNKQLDRFFESNVAPMTSTDFALAQQRIAARRQARESESLSQLAAQQEASRARERLAQLPYPLDRLGRAGISTWDSIRGREGTRPAFRVGQVDAELLDEELLELLKGQVGEALKYFGTHIQDDWSAEIMLVLRAVLFKLSVWDHGMNVQADQLQAFTDQPFRCNLRRSLAKLEIYRCEKEGPSFDIPIKVAESTLWGIHCRRTICMEAMGRLVGRQ